MLDFAEQHLAVNKARSRRQRSRHKWPEERGAQPTRCSDMSPPVSLSDQKCSEARKELAEDGPRCLNTKQDNIREQDRPIQVSVCLFLTLLIVFVMCVFD